MSRAIAVCFCAAALPTVLAACGSHRSSPEATPPAEQPIGAVVLGRVQTSSGAAVAGARVWISLVTPAPEGRVPGRCPGELETVVRTETDSLGSYGEILLRPPGPEVERCVIVRARPPEGVAETEAVAEGTWLRFSATAASEPPPDTARVNLVLQP